MQMVMMDLPAVTTMVVALPPINHLVLALGLAATVVLMFLAANSSAYVPGSYSSAYPGDYSSGYGGYDGAFGGHHGESSLYSSRFGGSYGGGLGGAYGT
eukprot:UN01678